MPPKKQNKVVKPKKSLVKNIGRAKQTESKNQKPRQRDSIGLSKSEKNLVDLYSDDEYGTSNKGSERESTAYIVDGKQFEDDDEISEDNAFNSDDERLYGEFFQSMSRTSTTMSEDSDALDDGSDVDYTDDEVDAVPLSSILDGDEENIADMKEDLDSDFDSDLEHADNDNDSEEEDLDDSDEDSEDSEDLSILYDHEMNSDEEGETLATLRKKEKAQKQALLSTLHDLQHFDSKKAKESAELHKLAGKQVKRGDFFAAEDQVGGDLAEDERLLFDMLNDEDSMNDNKKLNLSDIMSTLRSKQQSTNDDDDEEDGSDTSDHDTGVLHKAKALSIDHITRRISKMEKDINAKALTGNMRRVDQERLEREQAHTEVVEDVSKWEGVIMKNRTAPQLKFPFNVNNKKVVTSNSLNTNFNPVNSLEQDLQSLMKEYGFSEEEMKKREKLVLEESAITLDDLKEKEGRLQKMKALMFYQEQKQKHLSKIKSKSHRKYLKKLKEKGQLSAEELELIDPETAEKNRLKEEMDRVRERATLSHKNTSKWAKQQLKRGKAAEKSTRSALEEQLRVGRELARKMQGIGKVDENELGNDSITHYDVFGNVIEYSENDESDVAEEKMKRELAYYQEEYGNNEDIDKYNNQLDSKTKGLFSMAFMKRAQASKRADTKQMLDEMMNEQVEYDENGDVVVPEDHVAEEVVVIKGGKRVFGNVESTVKAVQPSAGLKLLNTLSKKTKGFGGSLFDVETVAEETNTSVSSTGQQSNTQYNSALAALEKQKYAEIEQKMKHTAITTSNTSKEDASTTSNINTEEEFNGLDDSSDEDDTSVIKDVSTMKGKSTITTSTGAVVKGGKHNKSAPVKDDLDNLSDLSDDDMTDLSASAWTAKGKGEVSTVDAVKRAEQGSKGKNQGSFRSAEDAEKSKKGPKKANAAASGVVLDMSTSVLAQKVGKVADTKDEKYDGDVDNVNIVAQDEQAALVSMAFSQGIDTGDAFEQEKLQEMNAGLPEEDPFAAGVPGWGSWGGAKVKKSKFQKKKENELRQQHKDVIAVKRQAVLDARTDKNLKNVLINQDKDEKALKYQIDYVPFPFTSRAAYERSLRVPLGPEWNTLDAHKKLNAPSMILKAGEAIQPIKWTKGMEKSVVAEKKLKEEEAMKKSGKRKATSQLVKTDTKK